MTDEIEIVDYFEAYRTKPEVIFPIPEITGGRVPMDIAIGKSGGGYLNEEYDGSWFYAIRVNGAVIYSGDDIWFGTPGTHAQAARVLVDCLINNADGPRDDHEAAIIREHGERLEHWLDLSFIDDGK